MWDEQTRLPYLLLVGAVALLRGREIVVSRRNAAALRARGGIEYGAGHYPYMVAIHAGWLLACAAEAVLLDRPFLAVLGIPMVIVFAAGVWLRRWAIRTLGDRWTTRAIVVPGELPITGGPYRFVRHPNYLGVVLELAALPLIHGAWATAAVFGVANATLLRVRIKTEEHAMRWATTSRRAAGCSATEAGGDVE